MINQTPEELAEYEEIIQRTFLSEEEGYDFFNIFAKNKGFSLRKGNVRYSENKECITSRQFVCSKEGFRQPKFFNMVNRRRPRPLTRFNCPFEVVIKHKPEMNLWYIYRYIDIHNHEMARSNECNKKRTSNDDMGGNEQQDNNLVGEAPPIHVQDPVQVMSKGAPKKMQNFLDKKRVRQCSECKGTDHNKRTCRGKKEKPDDTTNRC